MVHSRSFGIAVAAAALICACFYAYSGAVQAIAGDKGTVIPSANIWLRGGAADFLAGIGGAAVTVGIMLLLNKVYNVLRSMTSLYIALFAVMELATPDLLTQFYTGTLLAIVVPLCQYLLFSCFRAPDSTRHVFVIFLLLSLCAAAQYCFIFYIPVFLLGLGQMQIFGARSLLAAILGIITPWWILIGFGIVTPESAAVPHIESIFAVIGSGDSLFLLLTIAVTVFCAVLCYVLNLLRTIAYNAQARAFNGSFTLLLLVTAAAACADYRNIISYVPLLNYCAAMEITHYFSTHRGEKSFIPVLIISAAYAAIFACQTIL